MNPQNAGAAAGVAVCLALLCPPLQACTAEDATTGIVKATVVGIEVQAGCTYVLLKNVQTSLPAIDNASFVAGRFTYLAIDPAHAMYKPFLVIAITAQQTGQRIYASVRSRTALVTTLSVSSEENTPQ